MNSPCRCADRIIEPFIALGTNEPGGETLALILCRPPGNFGMKPTQKIQMPKPGEQAKLLIRSPSPTRHAPRGRRRDMLKEIGPCEGLFHTPTAAAYADILELPTADIVGHRVDHVHPALYQEQIGPQLDRAFAGERVEYELFRPTKNGDCFYSVKYEPAILNGADQLGCDEAEGDEPDELRTRRKVPTNLQRQIE